MWSWVYMCTQRQSRVLPATGVPVIVLDAVQVTGPSTTLMRPRQTWSAPSAADALQASEEA